jgi:hypothetical protein
MAKPVIPEELFGTAVSGELYLSVMVPAAASASDAAPFSGVALQAVVVPFVVRYLPALPPWDGRMASIAP